MTIGELKCLLYSVLSEKLDVDLTENEIGILSCLSMDEDINGILVDKKKSMKSDIRKRYYMDEG